MTRTRTITHAACAAIIAAAALAADSREHAPKQADVISLTLRTVSENRSIEIKPKEEDPEGTMRFSASTGIEAKFDVMVAEGYEISSIIQPKTIEAKDSAGNDLTQIEESMFDGREYLDLETFFDTPTVSLKLTNAARAAKTFSAKCETTAIVFQGTETVDVPQSKDWKPIELPSLAGRKIETRFQVDESGSAYIVIRPAKAARNLITHAMPAVEGAEPNGYSISYSDDEIQMQVDPAPEADQRIRLWVRKGMKEVPLVVEIKDQPLP